MHPLKLIWFALDRSDCAETLTPCYSLVPFKRISLESSCLFRLVSSRVSFPPWQQTLKQVDFEILEVFHSLKENVHAEANLIPSGSFNDKKKLVLKLLFVVQLAKMGDNARTEIRKGRDYLSNICRITFSIWILPGQFYSFHIGFYFDRNFQFVCRWTVLSLGKGCFEARKFTNKLEITLTTFLGLSFHVKNFTRKKIYASRSISW